jgi:hypothetical protein
MPRSNVRVFVSLVLFALLVSAPLAAQTKPKVTDTGIAKPVSAIFIGNSFFYYNNGMPGHMVLMLRAADASYKFRPTMVTISGSGADWHDVDSYFRANAIGQYSFDVNNNVVFNKIDGKLFDVAVLMDCSQCPVHPQLKDRFVEFARKNAETVRKHGATPVFFMSWGYADKPEMTAELAEAYTRAGNDNNAMVIPAGLAFAKSVKLRPELNLYASDKRHPSAAGTYLAASTTYAALFRDSPVGITYTAGLDQDTARFLQTVAWDTVQEYYASAKAAAKAN